MGKAGNEDRREEAMKTGSEGGIIIIIIIMIITLMIVNLYIIT